MDAQKAEHSLKAVDNPVITLAEKLIHVCKHETPFRQKPQLNKQKINVILCDIVPFFQLVNCSLLVKRCFRVESSKNVLSQGYRDGVLSGTV